MMSENSKILAPSLRKYIEENLGKATLNKIEQRLIERHGLGLGQAIKEFSKLDDVLHEIFGEGAKELESKFIQNNIVKTPANLENWMTLKELLTVSISKSIEDNLGKFSLVKIESRLMERYNLNVSQSIENFTKFDSVLKEFFGVGAVGLESRFLQNIAKMESLRNGFANLTIQEQKLAQEFLKPFAGKYKKVLLESMVATQMN